MAQSTSMSSTYQSAVAKGTRLLALTTAPNPTAQSPFRALSLFTTWGYTTETEQLSDMSVYHTVPGVITALIPTLSSSSPNSEDPVRFRTVHDTPVTVNGRYYDSTGALFQTAVHASSGILVAESNTTPAAMLDPCHNRDPRSYVHQLPALQHWSDVAFLQWKSLAVPAANSNKLMIPGLKVVVRSGILNRETLTVCEHIVNNLQAQRAVSSSTGEGNAGEAEADVDNWVPTWPGVSFDADQNEAKALCGTPNGKGVLWMLTQHRAELGRKTVVKVTLFYGDCEDSESRESGGSGESEEMEDLDGVEESEDPKKQSPSVLFWVGDVEEDEGF